MRRALLVALLTLSAALCVPGKADGMVYPTRKVLAVGDSITWGLGDPARESYRADLKNRLAHPGFPIEYVGSVQSGSSFHEGHPGWTINDIRQQVYGYLGDHQPDIVLIHLGTNDLLQGIDLATAHWRLNALLTQILAYSPDVDIFVMQVTGFLSADFQARADQYNNRMLTMSNLDHPNVHLVSQANVRGMQLWNTAHPNTFGYKQMGWNLYTAFRQVYGNSSWYPGTSPWQYGWADVCKQVWDGCRRYEREGSQWTLSPNQAGSEC